MKKKIFLTIGLTILLALSISFVAQAYTIDPDLRPKNEPSYGITEKTEYDGAATGTILVLQIIAGGLLYFAAPLAVIMIAFGASNMVQGGAESEKLEQAKKHLTWSILGLLLIILSYSVVKNIINFVIKAGEVDIPEKPKEEKTGLNKFQFGNIAVNLDELIPPNGETKHLPS